MSGGNENVTDITFLPGIPQRTRNALISTPPAADGFVGVDTGNLGRGPGRVSRRVPGRVPGRTHVPPAPFTS